MNIIPTMHYTWESQACQYPPTGDPGITLLNVTLNKGKSGETVVACLLSRDGDGKLIGILNRYYENNPHQAPNTGNLWVNPNNQHQGVATGLLKEAARLWFGEGTLDEQTFTREGWSWVESLMRKGVINPERTHFVEEGGQLWPPSPSMPA